MTGQKIIEGLHEAIAHARGERANDAIGYHYEDPVVWCCQGPPRCLLNAAEAVVKMQHGCMWCKRIICHPDGTQTVIEPGNS